MAILAYVLSYILTKLLQSNPHNARTHSEKQTAKIAASIEKSGFTSPIVCDEHHVVLAGHGRLQATLKLGLETVPTIRVHPIFRPYCPCLPRRTDRRLI